MPYCEGIEAVVLEEQPATLPAAAAPASDAGTTLNGERSAPDLSHGAGAPLPPATEGPSDDDRSLQSRFRKHLNRNLEVLRSSVTGERPLPSLPVQLRSYDSVTEASQAFYDTASLNVLKMRAMADIIAHRTMTNLVRPMWERFSSQEETE